MNEQLSIKIIKELDITFAKKNHTHLLSELGALSSLGGNIKGKVLISTLDGYKDAAPVITLALGDSDTGFNSPGDGTTEYWSNNLRRYSMNDVWHSGNFDPNSKISTTASCNKNWNWSGQGGQPSWLWGGNDGTNMYVYNPANFNVKYANGSGYVNVGNNNSGVFAGNGDGATYDTCNIDIKTWQGIGFIAMAGNEFGDNTRSVIINARNGSIITKGKLIAGRGIEVNDRIYHSTPNEALYLRVNGLSAGLGLDYNGFFRPQGDATIACGNSSWRFSMVYSAGGVSTSSDGKLKKHIKYITNSKEIEDIAMLKKRFKTNYAMSTLSYEGEKENSLSEVYTAETNSKVEELTRDLYSDKITPDVTIEDFYKFFKDDLNLATYRYDIKMYHNNNKRNNELNNVGFIAQDLVNSKIGQLFLVEPEEFEIDGQQITKEEQYLTYNLQSYVSVIAGGLKSAINKIEELECKLSQLSK